MSEPQTHELPNISQTGLQAERQRQVEALADDYLEHLLAGETPDRKAILAAHPDLADLLEPRLALVELMHRVARAERQPGRESLAPPVEHLLRVKCPHCGNGIQLIEPAPGEVTCAGCGSSFHLNLRATASYSGAALPRSIGKFEVLEQLGRGAFGTVYKARDPELQRLVAVKVPLVGAFDSAQEEERFLREARAAAQLSHPGIVPVLEIANESGRPYIVSEYVEGLTLADILTARRPGFREAAELVAAVADALDYAHHRQIVHRDIKPSNLLIDHAGRPHVTDFGLARRDEGEITVTLDGQIIGTPAYMAPEQAAGHQQHVDARSDVYSLGVVLYELLTGELPFRGNQRMLLLQVLQDEPRPPRTLNDRVPRDLETICLKAMAKVPGRRYGSAAEMASDLRRFLNGEPVRARPVGRTEKLARWARRNPKVAALTTAVALLLLAVAAVGVSFALYQRQANVDLSAAKDLAERNQRAAELSAASLAVDIDLQHCEHGEIENGVLGLARTLGSVPPHATELHQFVEMNLLAWSQELRPLGPSFQYDGAETTWEVSPDGLTVLTGGDDGTARLWDAFTGEVRATMQGHRGRITSVAFSENGRVAMTIAESRTVQLWDAGSGRTLGVIARDRDGFEKAILSPDGRRLLTYYSDPPGYAPADMSIKSVVTLWDTGTGRRISDLAGHTGRVNAAAFSPDGKMVLTGGADKTARLWSADSGDSLATLQGMAGWVKGVAFSPEGDVATTLENNVGDPQQPNGSRVRWWDLHRAVQIGPACFSKTWWGDEFRCVHPDIALRRLDYAASGAAMFVQGMEDAIEIETDFPICKADNDYLLGAKGRLLDRKSWKSHAVLAGRRFSDDLARFATDGRFFVSASTRPASAFGGVVTDWSLFDLRTERAIGRTDAHVELRHVPDRKTFVVVSWPSPRYIPTPDVPLDAEVAQLYAEVGTCHEFDPAGTIRPLDETVWDQRRRELVRRLDGHGVPLPISRLASDPWHWLRRRVDGEKMDKDKIKYLDRLIAVEPTWQNYHQRAVAQSDLDKRDERARDFLEAGKRAGAGYWHDPRRELAFLTSLVREFTRPAGVTPDEYELGFRLADALSSVNPEDRDRRQLHAIASYRTGRYAEALPLLPQREWERHCISQFGQLLISPRNVAILDRREVAVNAFPQSADQGRSPPSPAGQVLEGMAYLAMTYHRLGHPEEARAVLAHLRNLGVWTRFEPFPGSPIVGQHFDRIEDRYADLLREAEALIEGRAGPGK